MFHKPDTEKTLPQERVSPGEARPVSHPFLLAGYGTLEEVKVELVDHPVTLEEPQFEALVADSQCEV